MNKFRILAVTLFAMLAATAWAQDDYVNDETVPDNDETLAEVIDSKQYNKWTSSKNFELGVMSMTLEMDDVAPADAEIDETEPYKSAIVFFNKELKQHPRNAYAKCNIALCESHIASISLNMLLVDIFNGKQVVKIPKGATDEEKMALIDAFYQEKLKEKKVAINKALKLLDEGIAMLPAADKESRCKALLAKNDILMENDFDEALQEACLIEATNVHPCDNSYLKLLNFYSNNKNNEMVEKCAQKAQTYLPDNEIVQLYLASCEVKRENYDKALEIINQLISIDPENAELVKMRASTLSHAKRYNEAINDVVTLANGGAIDDAYTPLAAIATISDENLDMVLDAISKQEQHQFSDELPINWPLVEAMMHDNITHNYNKALECAKKAIKVTNDVNTLTYLADLYYKLGDVNKAFYILDAAAVRDDENDDAFKHKIEIAMNCGLADQVINDAKVQSYLGSSNLMPFSYSALGWALSAKGDWKNAIDCYQQWANSEEDNIMPTYYKARALVLSGQVNEGREILNEILATHDFNHNEEMKMNVLYYLGRTDESKAILDRLTANTKQVMAMTSKEIEDAEQLPEMMSSYNLACAHALHGDIDQAISFLKKHFEGNSDDALNYGFTILDYDFDNVRDNPKFLNIINEYKTRWLNGEYKPKE